MGFFDRRFDRAHEASDDGFCTQMAARRDFKGLTDE
jgi:hypothetical protein